jgi:hypothetical protein
MDGNTVSEVGSVRTAGLFTLLTAMALTVGAPATVGAQEPATTSRTAAIEQEQAEKEKALHPYVATRGEKAVDKLGVILEGSGSVSLYPYLESAYSGGGFAIGPGYRRFVSAYNTIDMRGSYSVTGYKRAEVEFSAPRLFTRRGKLSVLGGWREATRAAFYGIGTDTPKADRTNYDFQRPYVSATLDVKPTRRLWTFGGGLEYTQWDQRPGEGAFPSVETVYTPQTLPGLGAKVKYVHTQGSAAFDWRTSPGYARRGGFYGVTVHDYTDTDSNFGFNQIDYEAIQHFPILRETWAISLHALAKTTADKGDQEIPFFMLPSLGGGSTLRGFSSHRFRDRNSLLLQAEWRIMVSRYLDTAVFYDAGKVTARTSELDFKKLKHDYGLGARFHGPFATLLRLELARSNETGLAMIFAASPVF